MKTIPKILKSAKAGTTVIFKKALKGFHELKGTVFIKYFATNMFKIAGIVEGYIIVVEGEKLNA